MPNRIRLGLAAFLVLGLFRTVAAQDKPQTPEPPRRLMGEHRALGTVASVGVDRFEIKKVDGTALTVLVNDQTLYREQQQEFHLEDLKAGDHIAVRGTPNPDKQLLAAGVVRLTEEQYQRFLSGGGRNPGGPHGEWGPGEGPRIGGEIISIDQNRITVRNPWQGQKVILVNERTTFMKEGQISALKDLKVGDRIFALGKEQGGQFVATQVRSGQPRMRGPGWRQGPPPNQPAAPAPNEPNSPPSPTPQ